MTTARGLSSVDAPTLSSRSLLRSSFEIRAPPCAAVYAADTFFLAYYSLNFNLFQILFIVYRIFPQFSRSFPHLHMGI